MTQSNLGQIQRILWIVMENDDMFCVIWWWNGSCLVLHLTVLTFALFVKWLFQAIKIIPPYYHCLVFFYLFQFAKNNILIFFCKLQLFFSITLKPGRVSTPDKETDNINRRTKSAKKYRSNLKMKQSAEQKELAKEATRNRKRELRATRSKVKQKIEQKDLFSQTAKINSFVLTTKKELDKKIKRSESKKKYRSNLKMKQSIERIDIPRGVARRQLNPSSTMNASSQLSYMSSSTTYLLAPIFSSSRSLRSYHQCINY